MSIDKIIFAANKIQDYYPSLDGIKEVYESIIGAVIFVTEDKIGYMYDIENDIVTVLEDLY